MKLFKKIFLGLTLVGFTAVAQQKEERIYARINTEKGNIVIELTYDKTPVTVANFISLAEGTNKSVDKKIAGKKYYDGLNFHRVIKDFMIQGGDPNGNGSGNPGYLFDDEFVDELKHNRAGTLSMANRGPATNGSQFFITHKATPHLDGKHTVFGKVVSGQDVVDAIAQNDVIEKVEIIRVGKDAKRFNAAKEFSSSIEKIKKEEEIKNKKSEVLMTKTKAMFDEYNAKATALPSGVKVYIAEKGTGVKPAENENIAFDYAGYLNNGKLFDTGIESLATEHGILDEQRKAANAYQPLNYTFGDQSTFIKGMIEGLLQLEKGDKAYIFIPSELGYGDRALGPIPANSDLVFYVDIKQ